MKKILFTLPVVLLLAAGCNSNQPVTESQPTNTQPTQTQQTTPIGQSQTNNNDTGNIKTYRNDVFGFEVQIPKDWTVEALGSKDELSFFSQTSRQANETRVARCKDPKVKEEEALECSQRNVDMYFINTNYGNNSTKKETINGVEWTILEGENSGWQYETKQGGKFYHFSLPYLPENQAKIVQFLSTFKFTK